MMQVSAVTDRLLGFLKFSYMLWTVQPVLLSNIVREEIAFVRSASFCPMSTMTQFSDNHRMSSTLMAS